MRKLFVLGLAVLAVSVLGAVTASGASAETVWLVSGALATAQVAAHIEGLLIIDILNSIFGLVLELHCSGFFDGWVGPDAEDEITKILTLGGLHIEVGALGAEGTGIDCLVLFDMFSVCNNTELLIELWPDNLPWSTLLELMPAGEEEFLDIVGLVNNNTKEPGFDSLCLNSAGNPTEELCEGPLTAVLLNEVEGGFVLGTFLEETGNEQPCVPGSGNTAMVFGEGEILTTNGLSLAVSEG